MKRLMMVITVILALLVGMLPAAVFADDTGTSTGSFTTANVAPEATAMELYSDSALLHSATDITPQVTYYIKVNVTDVNSLDNIALITVKIFYDAAGTDLVTEDTITAGNAQTAAILTWTKSTGLWTIDAGSPTTWSIVTGSCIVPATMTDSSGYWVFAFKAGMVATESPGTDDWDINAKVTDAAAATYDTYQYNKEMLWYGNITVNTAAVDWGSVTAGTGFAYDVNNETDISVKYIANGNYDQKVGSSAQWNGLNSYIANFDATGTTTAAQEFSLKAYPSVLTDITDPTFAAGAVQVTLAGAIIDALGTLTSETGNTVTANTLWLKLASVFSADTYSGTITYMISNR